MNINTSMQSHRTVMDTAPIGPFRIFRESAPEPLPINIDRHLDKASMLAARELLRSLPTRKGHRELEPFSREWFEEIETKRYAPHGGWLRRVLEFTRHGGESIAMLGAGLGTDALQYQRHGSDVTICTMPNDIPELIEHNFALRGLMIRHVAATRDLTLPFADSTRDLVYINLLFDPPEQLPKLVREVYRVLKPGGKVFVLVPARYDSEHWQNMLMPFRKWYDTGSPLTAAPHYSGRELRTMFSRFADHKFSKRHLRRAELPYLWRFAPVGLLERIMGRVLVLRTFKPITAAFEGQSQGSAA